MILLAAAAMPLAGCRVRDAVKFHGVEDVSLSGGMHANILIKVENTSRSRVRVSNIEFTLSDLSGREIVLGRVDEELELAGRTVESVPVPIRFSLSDPVAGLRLLRNIDAMTDSILVSGSARVKRGGMTYPLSIENVPLSMILSKIDNFRHPSSYVKISI
jgi:hypothetical protein